MEVMSNEEDQALLKAYILAWSKFFNQCFYLSKPFAQVEKAHKKQSKPEDTGLILTVSITRKSEFKSNLKLKSISFLKNTAHA